MLINLNISPRIISIFITQSIALFFALGVFVTLRKRNKSKISNIISMFYLIAALGLSMNYFLVWAPNPSIMIILSFSMMYLLLISQFFILLFTIMLFKSEKMIMVKNLKLLLFIFYIVGTFSIMIIFQDIKVTDQNYIQYSFVFFIILVIFYSLAYVIPILILSIKVYYTINTEDLRRRWRFFIIGVISFDIAMYGLMIFVFIEIISIKLIISIITLITVIVGVIFTYYGIAKSL